MFGGLASWLNSTILLSEELKHGETVTGQVVEHPAVPDCFEVVMANEAYALLKAIR
jgi:hypothetical protein